MNQPATPIAGTRPRRTNAEFWIITAALVLTYAAYLSPLALAVMVGGLVFGLAAMRFRPLLLAVLFLLPINPYLSWDLPVKDLGTLVRLSLFVGVLIARQRSGESPWAWLFSGWVTRVILGYFTIAVLASVVFNPPNLSVARELMRFVSYLCFYYTVVDWVRTENDFKAVVNTLMFSTIGATIFGFYQYMIGDYSSLYDALYPIQEEALKNPPFEGRITSFLSHYNSLAGYLNMVIPFAVASALKARDEFTRVAGQICFVMASMAMVLTQSRGGLLAYVAVLVMSAYYLAPDRKARRRWIAAILITCFVGGILIGLVFTRLAGVDQFTEITRLGIWAGAGLIFLSHPIAGIGYGNFKTVLTETIRVPEGFMLDAHNLYMELLAETGILGFFAFLVLAGTVMRRAIRMYSQSRSVMDAVVSFGVATAVMSVMAHGAVDYLFHNSPQFAALFFLLLGLLRANEIKREKLQITQPASS
jgi:putative inorganic carbon (HCO3(-)) transporter